jgi:hypothetical protein
MALSKYKETKRSLDIKPPTLKSSARRSPTLKSSARRSPTLKASARRSPTLKASARKKSTAHNAVDKQSRVKKDTMSAAQKAQLTRTLKKMYPDASGRADKKWQEYSPLEQQLAQKFLLEKMQKKLKRKETWTKMQIIKYLHHIGETKEYTVHTLPQRYIKKYSTDRNFLEFKKFQGYKLLYRKIKGKSAKTNKQVYDFIKLLEKERSRPKK